MQLKLGFRMNVWQQVTRYQLTDLHMWCSSGENSSQLLFLSFNESTTCSGADSGGVVSGKRKINGKRYGKY